MNYLKNHYFFFVSEEIPFSEVISWHEKMFELNVMTQLKLLTLIAAAVGNAEPYNFSQTSCKVLQNTLVFSGSGLYISKMSKPAENTVDDD